MQIIHGTCQHQLNSIYLDDNSDHGNSGGPVLTNIGGKLKVVGILSGANKGSDSMKGRVVPIGAVFN